MARMTLVTSTTCTGLCGDRCGSEIVAVTRGGHAVHRSGERKGQREATVNVAPCSVLAAQGWGTDLAEVYWWHQAMAMGLVA